MTAKKNDCFDYKSIENDDPKSILKKWNYDDKFAETFDKQKIINDVKDNDVDFETVLYEIALWKIDRRIVLEPRNDIKNRLYSLHNNLCEKEVKNLINDLVGKNSIGVGLPMASTILHFFSDGNLPILDQRAYRVVFHEEPNYIGDRGELYWAYYEKCKDYYKQHRLEEKGINFSELDKYLYQVDKDKGNTNS